MYDGCVDVRADTGGVQIQSPRRSKPCRQLPEARRNPGSSSFPGLQEAQPHDAWIIGFQRSEGKLLLFAILFVLGYSDLENEIVLSLFIENKEKDKEESEPDAQKEAKKKKSPRSRWYREGLRDG